MPGNGALLWSPVLRVRQHHLLFIWVYVVYPWGYLVICQVIVLIVALFNKTITLTL